MTAPIRIVLADDHPVVRRGLRMLLDDEGDFDVSANAFLHESRRRNAGLRRFILAQQHGIAHRLGFSAPAESQVVIEQTRHVQRLQKTLERELTPIG